MSERVHMMDCGDSIRRADNGCFAKGPLAKTASFTVNRGAPGTFYTNRGAAGAIVATLPSAFAGGWYAFGRPTAQTLTVTATGGAKIDGGSANGSIIIAAGPVVVLYSDGTDWFTGGAIGTDSHASQYADVTIASAAVLTLFTTPVVIVPAPVADYFNELVGVAIILDAGVTPYTIGSAGNLGLYYKSDASGDLATVALAATGFLDSATDLVRHVKLATTNVAPVVGTAGGIYLKLLTANVSAGTGVLRVRAAYRVHPAGLA